nr:homocysteine S-methyltransferase family protein [Xanthocytophaga flavus]
MHPIEQELENRILILDGAMGTMIQPYGLSEADFRNASLEHHAIELKGNNDLLNVTRPDVIKEIHLHYLQAGADILSTNTFGANAISQEDYKTADLVYDINYQGAKIARETIKTYQENNRSRPLFVAGAMGPTTKLASMSPDVNNAGFRSVTFDQLAAAYTEQAKALIDGGVDLFLLETITDTLNAKAALFALMQLFDEIGQKYPIMVSGTIADASGRILSGQTIEAFIISISHAPLLSVGLNCALGAKELRPYIQTLDKEAPFYVSTHPNAGLPNQFGGYDQSAEEFASLVYEFAKNGWLNIVGGCCGTTPQHIEALASKIKNLPPRQKPARRMQREGVTSHPKQGEYSGTSKSTNALSLQELLQKVSEAEDEQSFLQVKETFEQNKKQYHPEQAMLINAHIFGRYQYLRSANKFAR